MREAIMALLPGDQFNETTYELLRTAPQPPEGLEGVVALRQEAQGTK